MFSAISATRLAILDAMMVYGDMFGCAPFTAPFVAGCAFLVALCVGFLVREAAARLVVRLTGAEATEAAGILSWDRRYFTLSVTCVCVQRAGMYVRVCSRAGLGIRRCPKR
jgi:ABC-type uncharacterized transport system permease subunit